MSDTETLRREWGVYLAQECNLSPLTAWTYECGIRRLETFTRKTRTALTVRDIREFLRCTNYSPATNRLPRGRKPGRS
jgi:hypothetical protein